MTIRTLLMLSLVSSAVAFGAIFGCHGHTHAVPEAGATTTTGASLDTATALPDVASLVAKVRPTVVNITTVHTVHARQISPFGGDMFDPFGIFGRQQGQGRQRGVPGGGEERVLRQQALGSGFVIDPQGHVVTNAHVVEDADADKVKVKLSDEREIDAKVKGVDRRLDLAVLELQGVKNIPYDELGSSEDLKVGEYVIAVGNPFGLGNTVTMGIVSAKSRAIGAGPYDDFIQTDASINPGNSGGPLFNMRGQVVGINTAIAATGQGIGFAIPSDALRDVLPQLLSIGHVERGRLGVGVQGMDATMAKAMGLDKPQGALIGEIEPGGPADKAGIKASDVIVAIDGTPIVHAQELPRLVARHAPGSKVKLTVQHGKQTRDVQVTLDRLKDEPSEGSTEGGGAPAPGGAGELGIGLSDAPGGGALVQRVNPAGAAHDALEPGDVILEVNGQRVTRASDAVALVKAMPRGQPALMKIRRDGHTRFVAIDRSGK
jgi:serine protease Do